MCTQVRGEGCCWVFEKEEGKERQVGSDAVLIPREGGGGARARALLDVAVAVS
jgi:hypothetical protein